MKLSPELEVAVNASQKRVIDFITTTFPTAKYFTVARETDHGEWYNYTPDVYDKDQNRLDLDPEPNPERYSDEWTNDWYESTASNDLDIWFNSSDLDSNDYIYEIGTGFIKDFRPPPVPFWAKEDIIYVSFGVFAHPIKTTSPMTVTQIREECKNMNIPENAVAYANKETLTEDTIIPPRSAVAFYRKMMERGSA